MTKAQNMARLRALTEMVLDSHLSDLRAKAAQRQATIEKLEGLRAPTPMLDDAAGISDALAALNFQIWAEARRAELSQTLARQTAVWLDSRDDARQAFGKARGFEKLAEKINQQKRPKL
jgi:hypothetical protein